MVEIKSPVTPERYKTGFTYAEYMAVITRNQERFKSNYDAVELTADDVQGFEALARRHGGTIHVLVLGEDWCGDVVANLPILARIIEACSSFDMRVFKRDENADIMQQYLNRGEFLSIPVFAFFTRDWTPLGHWIERPVEASQRQQRLREELTQSNLSQDDFRAEMTRRNVEAAAQMRRETLRELKELLERGQEGPYPPPF